MVRTNIDGSAVKTAYKKPLALFRKLIQKGFYFRATLCVTGRKLWSKEKKLYVYPL